MEWGTARTFAALYSYRRVSLMFDEASRRRADVKVTLVQSQPKEEEMLAKHVIPALLAVAVVPAASAELIVFDNTDGQFPWRVLAVIFDPLAAGSMAEPDRFPQNLLIDQPPTQSGDPAPPGDPSDDHALQNIYVVWPFPDLMRVHWAVHQVGCRPSARLAYGRTEIVTPPDAGPEWIVPRVYAGGESVGPGPEFRSTRMTLIFRSDLTDPPFAVWVPEHCFLGVEFDLPTGQTHYGWIELEAERNPEGAIARFLPIRWGYNDEPGAAAAIPIFGTGDCSGDGFVDLVDFSVYDACLSGPQAGTDAECACLDHDVDHDVDLADFAAFQQAFAILPN
jgi:hypothetical protein